MTATKYEVECDTCHELFDTATPDARPWQCDDCGRAESRLEQQAVDENCDYKEQT